jgi:hypothetical protein
VETQKAASQCHSDRAAAQPSVASEDVCAVFLAYGGHIDEDSFTKKVGYFGNLFSFP